MATKKQTTEIHKTLNKTPTHLLRVFGALSDDSRLRIFNLLLNYNDLCVTDLARLLNVSVPAASQQLKILESSGLVEKCRTGQNVCYKVKKNNLLIKSIIKLMKTSSKSK